MRDGFKLFFLIIAFTVDDLTLEPQSRLPQPFSGHKWERETLADDWREKQCLLPGIPVSVEGDWLTENGRWLTRPLCSLTRDASSFCFLDATKTFCPTPSFHHHFLQDQLAKKKAKNSQGGPLCIFGLFLLQALGERPSYLKRSVSAAISLHLLV